MSTSQPLSANVERFTGFAGLYDAYRPQPPSAIVDLLTQLAHSDRPALVVDIGAGTGLSTLVWAARAEAIVGIEPGDDMRRVAEERSAGAPNVTFRAGFSHATGLPDACADIVTISQALHWMEPEGTFAEVARLLRSGGVFAAYDCDWPPTFNWRCEAAYDACMQRAIELERAHDTARDVRYWNKRQHSERMQASGKFRFLKEIKLHHVERGGAERLVNLARSQGQVASLLKAGISEAEIGLDALRETAQQALGDAEVPWFWGYKVRIGIK